MSANPTPASASARPLLQIEGLRLSLGPHEILHGLDLSLAPGEILGLVGESGSGKSLTALSVLGLLPRGARCSGSIRLDGEELLGRPERALDALRGRDIGMVFQEPMTALNPLMSIGDQVAEVVRLHRKVSRAQALAQARRALDRAGLPASQFGLERYPHQLSGGQRQRVAIAIAIALGPRLLIADEPTTALDAATQAAVLSLLTRLVREDGGALLLVTHDLAVVAEHADRVAVLRRGRLVEQGATEQVLGHPASDYTAGLLRHARLQGLEPPPQPAPPEAPPLLELRGLVRERRRAGGLFARAQRLRAVDEVSLSVRRGETVGLVGESGCGKSTLLRTLLGLEPAQAGQVLLRGQVFSGREAALRPAVQIVFQDPYGSFDPRWRVWQLVSEPLHGCPGGRPDEAQCRHRVAALLEQVGLRAADADRYVHQFSGGQRQRLAIARALITEPALVVLDEAVSALDVSVRAQVLALLARLSRELGLAYLFVSHDLAVVRAISQRVFVMDQGRIVESGATEAVFAAPRHEVTRRLLAATPDLDRALAARRLARAAAQPAPCPDLAAA